jgi:hypothetical protein
VVHKGLFERGEHAVESLNARRRKFDVKRPVAVIAVVLAMQQAALAVLGEGVALFIVWIEHSSSPFVFHVSKAHGWVCTTAALRLRS